MHLYRRSQNSSSVILLTGTSCNGYWSVKVSGLCLGRLASTVLFDLTQLHLSVNSTSFRFSELVARMQAVSRPSLFPQTSKWDEAALRQDCS